MATSGTRKKRKPKRASERELLNAARELSDIAPGLKKFRRRKTLKPAEKGLITRTVNRVKKFGGKENMIVLTPAQQKVARKQKLLIGGGIAAVSRGGMPSDTKMRVTTKGKKKQIKFVAGKEKTKREFFFQRVPDIENVPDTMIDIIDDAKPRRVLVYLWTVHGRGKIGAGTEYAVEQEFGHLRNHTYSQYQKFNAVVGVTWFFP